MKKKIAYIVDTSCSLSEDLKKNKDVYVIPLLLTDQDGKTYKDGIDLDMAKMIQAIDAGKVFKTSASNLGALTLLIEDLLESYEKVIFIPIAQGISCQYQQSVILREEFEDKLFIVKNNTAVYGSEYLLNYLMERAPSSSDLNQLMIDAELECNKITTLFSCEDLSLLLRGGRTTKSLVRVVTFFKIKPIILLHGKNQLSGAGTNYVNITKKICKKIRKAYGDIWNNSLVKEISVYDGGNPQNKLDEICQIVSEEFNFDITKIQLRDVPNAVIAHTNKGSYGICVITSNPREVDISED